jgi:phage tail protein X
VLPQPAAECVEEAPLPSLDPQIAAAQELLPVGTGIHLVDPPAVSNNRTKQSLWPTATEPAVQLNLFG